MVGISKMGVVIVLFFTVEVRLSTTAVCIFLIPEQNSFIKKVRQLSHS